MSDLPLLPSFVPPSPSLGHFTRIEYLDFEDIGEGREFRLRVYGLGGSAEFRFRIAIAAFDSGRMRLQDGPDVCYQKLLRLVAAGETTGPDVITIEDVELASYREAHAQAQKHPSWTPMASPVPAVVPGKQPATSLRPMPVAPLITNGPVTAYEEGQRVSHATFGAGVTTASSRGRTVVCFDQVGPKTFVTSMLKVDVLSGPHTWETGRQGKNRLRKVSPPAA